jgi:hypothetical protein
LCRKLKQRKEQIKNQLITFFIANNHRG